LDFSNIILIIVIVIVQRKNRNLMKRHCFLDPAQKDIILGLPNKKTLFSWPSWRRQESQGASWGVREPHRGVKEPHGVSRNLMTSWGVRGKLTL
jgi:hypothetical protein